MSYNITNISGSYKIINGKGSWLQIKPKDNRNTEHIMELHKTHRKWGKIHWMIKNKMLHKIYMLLPNSTHIYRKKMYGFKRRLIIQSI